MGISLVLRALYNMLTLKLLRNTEKLLQFIKRAVINPLLTVKSCKGKYLNFILQFFFEFVNIFLFAHHCTHLFEDLFEDFSHI